MTTQSHYGQGAAFVDDDLTTSSDLGYLLDMLPADAASGKKPEPYLMSSGSGSSGHQTVPNQGDEAFAAAADDIDMWDMLMAIDGTPSGTGGTNTPSHSAPPLPFAKSMGARAASKPPKQLASKPSSKPLSASTAGRSPPKQGDKPASPESRRKEAAAAATAAAMAAAAAGAAASKAAAVATAAVAAAASPKNKKVNLTLTGAPGRSVAAAHTKHLSELAPAEQGGDSGPGSAAGGSGPGSDAGGSAAAFEDGVPSGFGGLAGMADSTALSLFDPSLDDCAADSTEEKRLKRMRRNRESAAMSRNRKKQYVEELEMQLSQLNQTVAHLTNENFELRGEVARLRGGPRTSGSHGVPSLVDPAQILAPSLVGIDPMDPLQGWSPEAVLAVKTDEGAAPAAGHKRPASPLLGGGGKRGMGRPASTASLAGLAVMSVLSFCSLSGGGGGAAAGAAPLVTAVTPSGSTHHAPGARMLMSLDEPVAEPAGLAVAPSEYAALLGRAAASARASKAESLAAAQDEADAGAPLWPALNSRPAAAAEPSSHPASLPAAADSTLRVMQVPYGWTERLVRLPSNSSWADAVRFEAAEKHLAQAQLALSHLGSAPTAAELAASHISSHEIARWQAAQRHVYEPDWEEEEEEEEQVEEAWADEGEAMGAAGANGTAAYANGGEASRYIFCSRAYMFEGARGAAGRGGRAGTNLQGQANLPTAMPARFRHSALERRRGAAASRVPQLTDGGAHPPIHEPAGLQANPVVSLLLPAMALQGVEIGGRAAVPSPPAATDLIQVQVRVLNASRWSAA